MNHFLDSVDLVDSLFEILYIYYVFYLSLQQRKILRYSYKRISYFRSRESNNKQLKRIAWIQNFLDLLKGDKNLILIEDEVGFGTSPLRKYAYSKVGQPASLYEKHLSHNLTCMATIS